jgi:hypothetical protein
VVVELHTESHAAKPSTRAWAITRRADRAHHRHADREQRSERHQADRASSRRGRQTERSTRTTGTSRSRPLDERAMVADSVDSTRPIA